MAGNYARGVPSAGVFIGPAAWLLSTQANYALVPWICAHQLRLVPVVSLALTAVCLFGGFLSWRAFRSSSVTPPADSAGAGRPHRFVAILGMVVAAIFAIAILMQGAAGLVFHGCER